MAAAARTIDVGEFINSRKLTSFNVILVVVSWLITVFDGFDQMTVSYTMPYMKDVLHLSKVMQGNVFSMGNFGMMAGGFCFAFMGDRLGSTGFAGCALILACVLMVQLQPIVWRWVADVRSKAS